MLVSWSFFASTKGHFTMGKKVSLILLPNCCKWLLHLSFALSVGIPADKRNLGAMRWVRNWVQYSMLADWFFSFTRLHIEWDVTAKWNPEEIVDLNVSRDGEAGGMGEERQLTLSLKLPAVVTTFQFQYTAQGFLAFYTVPLPHLLCILSY